MTNALLRKWEHSVWKRIITTKNAFTHLAKKFGDINMKWTTHIKDSIAKKNDTIDMFVLANKATRTILVLLRLLQTDPT
jgi:hypothetical protein